jgi:predicted secreted protein
MPSLVKWFRVIVCQWLLSIVIFIILAMSLRNLADYWRTANWIQVEGKIVCLQASNSDRNKLDLPWSGHGKLSCEYTYTFRDKNYSGNSIGVESFESPSPRARRYRQLKTQLDEGKPVTVFVNPAAPTESALFHEILSEMYFGPAIGLMWFGAFLWNYKQKCKLQNRNLSCTRLIPDLSIRSNGLN